MKKPVAFLTCSALVLSGCQMVRETQQIHTHTTYSDLWTSAEVAADEKVQSAAPSVNPDADPNRILTSKTESGNREYLFADSIKQENGKIMALIEYRYAQEQKLPANGLPYTHNHWFEEIDCSNKIRNIRTTTHYNAQGEIVDANEYPALKLSPAQMKQLAQPDDGVIKEVCQRVGGGQATISGSPEANPQRQAPTVSGSPEVDAPAVAPTISGSQEPATPSAQAASEAAPASPPPAEEKPNKRHKNKKQKAETAQPEKKSGEIDFIQRSKQENQPKQENKPETLPEKPASNDLILQDDEPSENAVQPKQHDELPPDFWTIGMPQE